MTPDVNVLVAASRADHVHHPIALDWINRAVRESTRTARVTLMPMVAVGFVRVVTNRRIFVTPTPLAEALATIDDLLSAPHVRMATVDDGWPGFRDLAARRATTGDAISDAWIASSVMELNETLVTFDRAFRRLLTPKHLRLLA